jgi:hypothetical protein
MNVATWEVVQQVAVVVVDVRKVEEDPPVTRFSPHSVSGSRSGTRKSLLRR